MRLGMDVFRSREYVAERPFCLPAAIDPVAGWLGRVATDSVHGHAQLVRQLIRAVGPCVWRYCRI